MYVSHMCITYYIIATVCIYDHAIDVYSWIYKHNRKEWMN